MSYLEVTHIAVTVPDLREAEAYYCNLFDLEVAWRDSNGAASLFATWSQIDAAGAVPEVAMLWRDSFKLALTPAPTTTGAGPVSHFGLQVTPQRLADIRARVADQRLDAKHSSDETFSFADRYGVDWELDTRSFRDPRDIGRQLEARQQAIKPS